MPLRFANRVKESSATDGTGIITLDGAYDSYQSFSNAFSDNDTTYYTIVNGNSWEVGIGTYASGTLSRDTIFSSSDSGNILNLNGLSSIFVVYPSEKPVFLHQPANPIFCQRFHTNCQKVQYHWQDKNIHPVQQLDYHQ